jgi:general secretion pathway protein A
MYEAFYGFKEKPFTLTPDPRYFYPSRAHREALDHLLYGIREREGFIVITGDVGTGKTTLCRAILQQLEEGTTTAVILNPILSEEELLRAVLRDFGLTGAGRTKNELIAELNEFLLQTIVAGRRAVLIVDEAQNLSHDLLEQVRLLSNLETERDKLIQIILVGQLGLLKNLASPELKQLNQRVSVRYRLKPLTYQETCQYIYHRLMVAGGTTGVSFSGGALKTIYRFSEGIPRLINLAADRALLQGFTDQEREITKARAEAGIRSLRDEEPVRRVPLFGRALFGVLLIGAVIAAVFAAGLIPFGRPEAAPTAELSTAAAARSAPSSAPAPGASPARIDSVLPAGQTFSYSLLVGSFSTEPEARALEQRLAARGVTGIVARAAQAGAGTFNVLVGHYGDAMEAQQALDGLTAQEGFASARIVRTADSVLAGSPQ